MPAEVRWLDKKRRILLQEVRGDWTLAEFEAMSRRSDKLIRSVDYDVAVLVDFSQQRLPPTKLLNGLRSLPISAPPNIVLVVMQQPDAFIRGVIRVFKVIAPQHANRIHYAESRAEALEHLFNALMNTKA